MSEKTVFISYSHDTPEHIQQVLQLANALRGQGVDIELDPYHVRPSLGWPLWCEEQLRPEKAAFVLVICTETYRQRVEGKTPADEGRGVFWEGRIISSYLYNEKGNKRFIPVLLPGATEEDIPRLLRDDTRYQLRAFDLNDAGYVALYRELTGQPAVTRPPVGAIVNLPPDALPAVNVSNPLPPRQILTTFSALVVWQEKLSFLLEEEAKVVDPAQKVSLRKSIEEARAKIREHGGHAEETASFAPGPPAPFRADISRIDKYAPVQLIGREAETQRLNDAWAKAHNNETNRPHVLTFVALGGEGKTSLVAKWAADLAYRNWPGCKAAFAWPFYSQGTREQVVASSDVFLKEALTFFGDAAMAGSAQGAFDKGRRLAQLVGERRALLILDGLEPLQYAPTSPTPGVLKDSSLAALLKGLAANNKGLCVVTSRYSIPDLRAFRQTTAPEVELRRLSTEAGVALLRSLGVRGTQIEFETLVEDVKGHALTLNLLGTYLRDAYAGDIRRRDLVNLAEADEEQGGHAFRVMDAYVRWFESEGKHGKRALAVLRLLGLFDRPADAGCLKALWKAPLIPDLTEPLAGRSEAHRNLAITRLEEAKLLTVNRDAAGTLLALDAHPLLREYFAKALSDHRPVAWCAAHRRLYEHLCATTKDKPQPTLEDLQPLYQAVAHGCRAGMQWEACAKVYFTRIQRGNEFHSANKLGAWGSNLGAVACFFEQVWSRVSSALTEDAQSWMLNEAAVCLRALGRLIEALEPLRAGLEMVIKQEDWPNAASGASNLSELELTLGDVASAVQYAEQSVTYADRSGDTFRRITVRTTHAEALHQADCREEAAALFREAGEMQAANQPEYPLLYSVQGFLYCGILLAAAERAAWRSILNLPGDHQSSSLPASCHAVSERVAQTLHWAEQGNLSLLTISLDHLTLGRAALYAAILEGLAPDRLDSLQHAVDGLRRAGAQHYLPSGLLTRAWLRCLTGAPTGPESAQSDLEAAWEIAERGPMPLFMANTLLHRARLFGLSKDRSAIYPWTSSQDDLAEARRLIEKHGYWRRKEELEDAEAAARQ